MNRVLAKQSSSLLASAVLFLLANLKYKLAKGGFWGIFDLF
jgi:hypothetical protein